MGEMIQNNVMSRYEMKHEIDNLKIILQESK